MNMKKSLIILTFFFAVYLNAQGLPNITPPSPTAASLAQFADVPVSNYTGLPNIDVPIYTVQSGPLSVPITLQYHGGGIKAAQEASWVGLGWSLNAGGVVTRMIRGHDDLQAHIFGADNTEADIPYVESTYDVPDLDASETELYYNYQKIIYDRQDNEPDIFYYNFGSFSGKFVLEKPENIIDNVVVGRPLDADAVKILYYKLEHYWLITDLKGNEYRFSVPETTQTYSYDSDTSLANMKTNKNQLINDGGPPYITSTWYIKEISSPISKHKITFEYETNLHKTKSQNRYREMNPTTLDENVVCVPAGLYIAPPILETNCSTSIDVTRDVYLSRIDFSNGYVDFNTGDRIDMVSAENNSYNPQKLKSIFVYNKSYKKILQANLDLDYFSRPSALEIPEYYRLKLRGVSINDQIYKFEYNEPNTLPSKITSSVDHWGYFNNASNQTLIPATTYKYFGETRYKSGADRQPNEDYTKYFVLEKITLPTGGTQTFNWESNEYFGTKIIENIHRGGFPNDSYSTSTSLGGSTMVSYESEVFEITDPLVRLKVNFLVQKINDPDYLPKLDEHPYVGYYKWENGTWIKYQLPYLLYYDIYGNGIISMNLDYNHIITKLTSGRYKMIMSHLDNLRVAYAWSYIEKSTTTNTGIKGAGLRIQNIEINDGIKTTTKEYEYLIENSNKSSGIPMDNPVYYYYTEVINGEYYRVTNAAIPTACALNGRYLLGYSNSLLPLSVTGDNFMGYSRVRTNYIGETTPGEIIYEYYNFSPITTLSSSPLPNIPTETNPKNGKPISITVKNANGAIVERTDYTYKIENNYRKNTPGMFVHAYPWDYLLLPEDVQRPIPQYLSFQRYNNYSDWCYLENETNIKYDLNGDNPVTIITNYSYENDTHLQLTRTETVKSGGKKLITKMIYPDDVITTTTLNDNSTIEGGNLSIEAFNAIKRLKHSDNEPNGLHRIGEAIQTTTYEDKDNDGVAETNELLSIQRANYKDHGNDLVLPKDIQTLKGIYNSSTNELQDRIIFHDYYDNGNLKEVSKKDGTTTVYIWGYNEEYPIAKIENASYTSIESLSSFGSNFSINTNLSTTQESELRTLPNAMVTTYTYNPLIGVTSITDSRGYVTYYEYDGSNRLKQVIDADGNILSENKYHYKGQ